MSVTSVPRAASPSQARVIFSRLPSAPSEEQVARWQAAARAIGLTVSTWHFDHPDGRPGGAYSRIELNDPATLKCLAVLWEA